MSKGWTLNELISRISTGITSPNLSSALRVFVLEHYRNQQPEPVDRGFEEQAGAAAMDEFDRSIWPLG